MKNIITENNRGQVISALSKLEGYAHLQVIEDLAQAGKNHSELVRKCINEL